MKCDAKLKLIKLVEYRVENCTLIQIFKKQEGELGI